MDQEWTEIRLRVPAGGVDLISAALDELGCTGLIVEERQLDTFIPPDPDEVPVEGYRLRAFFAAAESPRLRQMVAVRLQELSSALPGLDLESLQVLPLRTEDWAEGWKQNFTLTRFGRRLVVRPTWEEYLPLGEEAVVVLDPGMAFGTGTHGTTRLCLEAVAALFDGQSPPRWVLDVGTGSGILAIAAAALGAERVLACDIDPQACVTARENVAANAVAGQVEVTQRPLQLLEGGFQLILANILAEELVRLGPELVGRLESGGTLVLSGILQEKEALVETGFAPLGLLGPAISRLDEWSCLLFRKP
ncbi:MAG: 50S ribosomal protein L11 methyltransferase [Desulfuromonadales bacterium]|nr:50S ribosomal protein L11 methyltransferase [Desulfuromonadales bacterium]